MEILPTDRLQPPFPSIYKVPTLVQPGTTVSNLLASLFSVQDIKNFEEDLREYYNVKHCILLDRPRTGAYLLAKAMNLDDEWISTSFMHRPFSVLLANIVSRLAFADIDSDFTINTKSAESLINSRTQALLVTHMYGKSADIVKLRKIADRHGLFLIENCVHMSGKFRIAEKVLGSWGDAALLSFNVDKPLAGLLGGALLTNRDDVWNAVKAIRLTSNSISSVLNRIGSTYVGYYMKSLIVKIGLNNKQSDIDGVKEIESFPLSKYKEFNPKRIHYLQKVAASNNLKLINKWVEKRVEHATLLNHLLQECQSLVLPTNTILRPNCFLYFPIIFKDHDRYRVSCMLANKGIETKWRYFPLHVQDGFKMCPYNTLDNTFNFWKKHLLIPIGHKLQTQDIHYIAKCIIEIVE